jgi:uncharacterized membrane protein YkvA (DUF1232 family)
MTLWLALRHRATPWAHRALAFVVVAYAPSPIDRFPDVMPELGSLDDANLAGC